jgi:hypothetical protein
LRDAVKGAGRLFACVTIAISAAGSSGGWGLYGRDANKMRKGGKVERLMKSYQSISYI